jgi:hypothetical protein
MRQTFIAVGIALVLMVLAFAAGLGVGMTYKSDRVSSLELVVQEQRAMIHRLNDEMDKTAGVARR